MDPQQREWTCSICSLTWVIQSTGTDPNFTREMGAAALQYPVGVNETYGLTSITYMLQAFESFGLHPINKWVTFDEAYAICRSHTGVINPIGMYHFMAIRGIDGVSHGELWLANSAPGYRGIYDSMSRNSFNQLGPVQIVYLTGS